MPILGSLSDDDISYIPDHSDEVDTIEGKYNIDTSTKLAEYDSDFAKAYALSNVEHSEHLYALILDKKHPARLNAIHHLKSENFTSIAMPKACQIIDFSVNTEEVIAVIIEKGEGKSIRELVESGRQFSEEFLRQNLIAPIVNMLHKFEQLGICHGNINVDTILLDNNNQLTLKECISFPCGFYQNYPYETINRAMLEPLAKGEGNVSDDYYALGILLVHLILKEPLKIPVDDEELLISKLHKGSFNTMFEMLPKDSLSDGIKDLLIGLLSDDLEERWGSQRIVVWLKGKAFNLMHPLIPREGTRGIVFNNVAHYNRKALAYSFYHNWYEAKKFVQDEKLPKWVEGSIGDEDAADEITNASLTIKEHNNQVYFDLADELVARIILLLDPTGPIRSVNIAFNVNAMGSIFIDYLSNNNKDAMNLLSSMLSSSFLTDAMSTHFDNKEDVASAKNAIDKLGYYIYRSSCGFGMERCMYELNPFLPCQAPLLSRYCILTVPKLIRVLDKEMLMLNLDTESDTDEDLDEERTEVFDDAKDKIIDDHIVGFIASNVKLNAEISIKSLSLFPDYAKDPLLQRVALVVLAINTTRSKIHEGITRYFSLEAYQFIEKIHSTRMKREILKTAKKFVKEGNVPALLAVLTQGSKFAMDAVGFKDAKRQYRILYRRMQLLKNTMHINNSGFRYGLHMAVFISYFLCAIEVLFLVTKNM